MWLHKWPCVSVSGIILRYLLVHGQWTSKCWVINLISFLEVTGYVIVFVWIDLSLTIKACICQGWRMVTAVQESWATVAAPLCCWWACGYAHRCACKHACTCLWRPQDSLRYALQELILLFFFRYVVCMYICMCVCSSLQICIHMCGEVRLILRPVVFPFYLLRQGLSVKSRTPWYG